MDTLDLEDLFLDVITELEALGLKAKIREWGWLTVKEWVRDHIENDETLSAAEIAKAINEDWENEQL